MDGAKLVLVLKAWLVFLLVITQFGHSRLAAGNNYRQAARKLANDNPGFISINCGTGDYFDDVTGVFYKSDKDFVDTGSDQQVSSDYILSSLLYGHLTKNLRNFPEGTKNCYNLKPEQGKNNNYLIRGFFYYGNYDNKNQIPEFDVYIGVNYWMTVQLKTEDYVLIPEIIHVPSSDIIFVCLINTGSGIPFISALELRPLDNSIYRIESGGLDLRGRYDLGPSNEDFIRYKEDVYDRLWFAPKSNSVPISTSSNVEIEGSKDGYKLPAQVLRTAVQPPSGSNSLVLDWYNSSDSYEYYVYFHFAEIANVSRGQKRKFNISLTGVNNLTEPITLDYLKTLTISPQNGPITGGGHFVINVTTGSDLPPILNAFENFRVVRFKLSPTDPDDVAAMMAIKKRYSINSDNWQGDPCVPSEFSWNDVNCSSDNTLRIISLNLSSRQLKGEIATSLSNLTALQSLDLSNNELSGPIPEFFAQMPNLKILNLTGNKLTGSVPEALKEKAKNKSLDLSFNNLGCSSSSSSSSNLSKNQKEKTRSDS